MEKSTRFKKTNLLEDDYMGGEKEAQVALNET